MRSSVLRLISICSASAFSRYDEEETKPVSSFQDNWDDSTHSYLWDSEDEPDTSLPDYDEAKDPDNKYPYMWDSEHDWNIKPEFVNEYPYPVKIYGKTICTGVRYKDDIIITTASCAQGKPEEYSGVGFFDDIEPVDVPSGYDVLKVIPHLKYAIDPRAYDIGIIQIDVNERRPQYNYFELTSDHSVSQPGAELNALIWGTERYSADVPILTHEFQSFTISVLNETACGDLVSQLHPLLEFCAGVSRHYGGLYEHHIGSPVFIEHDNITTIVGLFAQTVESYGGLVPGEFTRLSQFRRWIDTTIQGLYTLDYDFLH